MSQMYTQLLSVGELEVSLVLPVVVVVQVQ
jgi:hypothetical protein